MRFSGRFARARPGAVSLDLLDFRRLVAGYMAARLCSRGAAMATPNAPDPRLVA